MVDKGKYIPKNNHPPTNQRTNQPTHQPTNQPTTQPPLTAPNLPPPQCALALGVSVGRDGAVDGAGGYLVQVLPFADDETLAALEANIAAAGPVTAMLAEGLGPREVTARLLAGLGAGDEGFSLEPSYGPCDAEELRERMRRAIATLGEGEARAILEEQGRVEMTCEFCRVTHALDEAEVLAAVAAAQA